MPKNGTGAQGLGVGPIIKVKVSSAVTLQFASAKICRLRTNAIVVRWPKSKAEPITETEYIALFRILNRPSAPFGLGSCQLESSLGIPSR